MQKTKTFADGKIEMTVVKFEAMRGFTMLGKLQAPGAQQDPTFLREMLAGSFVVRTDEHGHKEQFQLGGGDTAINNAFRGFGVMTLIEAQNFAIEVNFADFLAESARRMAERLAKAPAAASD